MKNSNLFLKSALVLAMAVPMLASAESNLTVGASAGSTATARLNFSVIIPKVLFLAVGTGNATIAASTTVDTLTFNYTATPADIGTGTDTPTQPVTVRVLGNNGTVAVAAAGTTGGLTNGTETIAWTEILATSSDATNFNVPAVGSSVNLVTNSSKITNRTTTWNYAYSNTNVVVPGTYAGTVTYTATMP